MDRLSHRQEVHLDVCSYCRDCLVTLVLTKSAEDRSRFDALLDSWGPGGEIILQKGDCARCGYSGEVCYFVFAPPNPDTEQRSPDT